MFVLHTSNKTENLLAHLDKVLATPLSSPFIKEEFVIQSQGMQRWLCQQLAERKPVWANFDFSYPGKFFGAIVDQISAQINQEQAQSEPFNQENMVWHFDDLLRQLEGDEFRLLLNYMQGDNGDLKRYQLAESLAYLFDQYQFMRPDWLAAWEQNKSAFPFNGVKPTDIDTEKWQRKLWQELLSKHADYGTSKGVFWLSAINNLLSIEPDSARKLLPERLCVFGINAMSPIYLKFLETIGSFIDVHFFLLNPTEGYWADLPAKRELTKQIAENGADETSLFDIDNALLSALGQQGRDFQQLLLEQSQFELKYVSFEAYQGDSVLSQLQNDVLLNRISSKELATDNSISIHSCHSRMRETEILKDQLLQCLDDDNELTLRDIVVMMPDVSKYAPYISAVFEDIPHAIADRKLLDSNNVLSVFLRFLSLSQSRWELESVLDVLDQAVVSENLGLLETDLEHLRTWIQETNIRWGESGEHRQQLGFPEFTENSWQAGLERLLMGYAISDDTQLCDGILPYADIEGSQALALGGLYDFFQLLSQAKKVFSATHNLADWVKYLTEFAESLLASTDDFQHQYTELMKMIQKLESFQEVHQHNITLDVILSWFDTTAGTQQSGSGFLRGQLTFCSMLPMRAIPFKVIALIGMNENEYPRAETRTAFDLMANYPRKGDKTSRLDERYQFLEVLLSTQQQLIITYIGQSQKRNESLPPSIVVAELLEVLVEYYQLDYKKLVTHHPLQPFSSQYFSKPDQLFSYSKYNYHIHQSLQQRIGSIPTAEVTRWWQGQISNRVDEDSPKEEIKRIELQDLLKFYEHPQRHFLQQQLLIRIPRIEKRADETEPFVIDGLSQYQISQEWVARLLSGEGSEGSSSDEDFYLQLKAQGRWLGGTHGRLIFEVQQQAIEEFVERINSAPTGSKIDSLAVDVTVGEYRIVGTIAEQYQQGNLLYRYAKLKAKDLLATWITHLITLQLQPTKTWLISKDQDWYFDEVDNSEEVLKAMIDHYCQGQLSPSPLIVDAGIEWQKQRNSKSARSTPLSKALSVYQGLLEYDADLSLLYQGLSAEDVINEEFEEACELLTPIWQTLQ